MLKDLFGSSLGTGDYGHLATDHTPMSMRRFLSMTEFSQQGFEASHKDQRQLWLKTSSHDQHGKASSSKLFNLLHTRKCYCVIMNIPESDLHSDVNVKKKISSFVTVDQTFAHFYAEKLLFFRYCQRSFKFNPRYSNKAT